MSETLPDMIGFAPSELTDRALRLPVVAAEKNKWVIISKPADVLFEAYTGVFREKSIISAIRSRLGKGEFERLGISTPFAVNQIDVEFSGGAMLAMNKDSCTDLRNSYGSDMFNFEYLLLCKKNSERSFEAFDVDLPMYFPEGSVAWTVSHRRGKKAFTSFEPIEDVGEWQLWKSSTKMPRPHQIRLHAFERGLLIAGESLYAQVDSPRPNYRDKSKKPIHAAKDKIPPYIDGMGGHLCRIECMHFGIDAKIALPDKWKVALKKLGFTYTFF